ncbi:hypothetical protein ACEF96_004409 [Salmonella enterica]|nr:hypothetical protein [Salmonella enterica]
MTSDALITIRSGILLAVIAIGFIFVMDEFNYIPAPKLNKHTAGGWEPIKRILSKIMSEIINFFINPQISDAKEK